MIILLFISTVLLFSLSLALLYNNIILRQSVKLYSSLWDKTLNMWLSLNKLQAARQKMDIDALYEETLRNTCVQDKIHLER